MTAKYRWRVDMNWLCGTTLGPWLRQWRAHGVAPDYLHRAALITVLSAYHSLTAALAGPPPPREGPDPVFVLGHWRSGTTWLHHLLAGSEALCAPTAYQVVNPTAFAHTEGLGQRVFGRLIPAQRLQDDVPLGFSLPEEDEYAIALLSGCSPYLGRSFPRALPHYERFLTLDDCTDSERAAFRAALDGFCARLQRQHPGQRIVLKSPAHTARVRWLRQWYPDARFVHVHRDPYAVFASTRHLYDTVDWLWTLQRRPGGAAVDDTILRQYRALHAAWFAARDAIPEGRLHELAYEELVADPQAALDGVFGALALGPAPRVRSRAYQPNRFPPLSAADRARVREAAAPCFAAWGYPC